MSLARLSALTHHLRRLFVGEHAATPDGVLLQRFAEHGDETAFTALMRRHGSLVLGVCQRVLRHEQDAEDVFQATFLVLARKASRIRKRASVGSWLYGVAYRLAKKAQAAAARRVRREGQVVPPPPADPAAELTWRELRGVLDEELERLPERYRAPLLLCYFEGLTQDEAARQLGWAKRTVKSRLARGRERLRLRLARRGLTLGAALTGPLLAGPAVPAALAAATVRAACLFAAGETTVGVVSTAVLTLARGGLTAMLLSKVKVVMGMVVVAVFLAGGAGMLLSRGDSQVPVKRESVPVSQAPERPVLPDEALPAGAVVRLGTSRFRHGDGTLKLLACLPDGKVLITANGSPQGIRLWDMRTGRMLREFHTGFHHITAFALSPDGRRLALGGPLPFEKGAPAPCAVRVLDCSSGKVLMDLARTREDVDCALAFTPDGQCLASVYRHGMLRFEEIPTGVETLRRQFPSGSGPYIAMSPDGTTLAISCLSPAYNLFLWNWKARREPIKLEVGEWASFFAFFPDGKRLAVPWKKANKVRLFDTASGLLREVIERPATEHFIPGYFAFSPDGKSLAIVCVTRGKWAGRILLWDLLNNKMQGELNCGERPARQLTFTPDSRQLAVESGNTVRLWDLASGKELTANDAAHDQALDHVAVSGQGVIATASADSTARLWKAATGGQIHRLPHGARVAVASFSPDGRLLATASFDDAVRLWDVRTGVLVHQLRGHGTLGPPHSLRLRFTFDGKQLLSLGGDFYLRAWDVAAGKVLREIILKPDLVHLPREAGAAPPRGVRLPALRMPFSAAEFSADGKVLVLALPDRHFHILDILTGKEIRRFPKQGGGLASIAVSPDAKRLLGSVSGEPAKISLPNGLERYVVKDHTLSLWDLGSGKLLHQLVLPDDGAGPVAFSPDGKLFAAAVNKPEVHIRLWNAANCEELPGISGFLGEVRALAFSPDGRRLVSGMEDTTALVWDLTRKR